MITQWSLLLSVENDYACYREGLSADQNCSIKPIIFRSLARRTSSFKAALQSHLQGRSEKPYLMTVFDLTYAQFFTRLAIFVQDSHLASARNLLPSKFFQTVTAFSGRIAQPTKIKPQISTRGNSMSKFVPQSITRSRLALFMAIAISVFAALILTMLPGRSVQAVGSSTIVISQVYGGGGNSGATLKNDFIELFNRGTSPVDLSTWSVQYAATTGSSWQRTNLSGILQPGHYYLVQEAAGTGGTTNLPTPDATGSIAMALGAGKVALITNQTTLGAISCPTGATVIDFVGFGSTTNCFEGTGPTPTLTNTTAASRASAGCTDTDNNSSDFTAGAPNPRNTASATNTCGNISGTGLANPNSVVAGGSTLLTVTVTPGVSPASTGIAVTTNLTAIGGSASQQFFDNGTNGDLTANDNIFSFQATVSAGTPAGAKSLTATITDAQLRSAPASISLTVTAASTPPTGVGSAVPSSLQAGNTTLLKVTVTPGTNPASTGIAVNGDLSSIGGSASQQFYDDATHGDVTSGDKIFSFQATVSAGTIPGGKTLPITVSDSVPRSTNTSISLTVLPPPPPTTIKISQAYGGGGNSGSTYTNDFIEVFNQGPTTIDVSNWSVQYNSATLTGAWQVTPMCAVAPCTIAPGHYYLVQESQGANGTTSLPAPDATGVIAMSGSSAKVALVASTSALTGCPTGGSVVDLVGYGPTANCSETTPTTPSLDGSTAVVRLGNGCVDTDNNRSDFLTVGPIPRNKLSPVHSCGGDPTQPSGLGIATPDSVEPASNTILTVKVTPATIPASTGLAVTADLTSIGGPASQTFFDDASNGDTTAGDNTFSFRATTGAAIGTGIKNMVATITDQQGRSVTAPIFLTIESPTCGVERWTVKVGTDPDVGLIDLNNPVHTTIDNLAAMTPPADPPGPPDDARIAPAETTVYVVNATMTLYKKEGDVDYHVVLQDENGHTMIVEIPSPGCIVAQNPSGPGRILVPSPLSAGIALARSKFDDRFNATTSFQTANIPVQITGVGFFDFIHGQTGVAPNGIELHPVLNITFTANTSTTLTSNANPSQFGNSVDITATVTSGGTSTPTGTVDFFDNGSLIGSRTLDPTGHAIFSTSTFSVGSHPITVHYEGDSASATSTSTALTQVVNKADQTINFGPLTAKTFGDADFTVSATTSSNLTVTFSIVSGPATISGSTVHITGAGFVTIRASQAGDGNYNPATDVDQSFEVAKATPAINWNTPADIVYGTALSGTQLNATTDVGGSFSYTPASGTVLDAGLSQPLLASFTPTDTTNYNATSKTVMINVLKANPSFSSLSSPTIECHAASTNVSGLISFGPLVPTGNVAITLNAVTQSTAIQPDGSFSANFDTSALTPANSPLSIAFSYAGDGNFNPASGLGALTIVDTGAPTITLNGNQIALWSPNHSYHTVNVSDLVASASDSCDANVNLTGVVIAQVSSDEGNNSSGDILIAGDCKSVQLRAERDGDGDGRIYTITFSVKDAAGHTTTAIAQVTVPHDQGYPNAIDSGPAYTITGSCP
jgi:hypothetical protein